MITEISYILDADMPRWPTNPAERLEKVLSFENGDPNNAFSCYHHMHNGTHVDAPGHFSRGARMIEEIPVEDFYYTNPVLLDFPRGKGGSVGREGYIRKCGFGMSLFSLCGYKGEGSLQVCG